MAAVAWLTQQADAEQERADLAAAMRVSLEEADAARAAAPPLSEWTDEQLLERFACSASLPQVGPGAWCGRLAVL